MGRSAVIFFAFVFGVLPQPAGAQDEKGVPKELVQYVRDAQKAGLKAPQIREKALKAGWPEAAVDGALESVQEAPKTAGIPPAIAKMTAEKDPSPEVIAPLNVPGTQPADNQPAKPTGLPKPQEAAAPPRGAEGNPSVEALRAQSLATAGVRGDDYQIGEGDVLQIAVWGEPTASVPNATVRTDGKISMPLIKEVQVAGLTPAQVETIVQGQLAKVLRAPDVTVIVAQINSKKIFLTGAVKREGPLKYTYRMSVLQAISESGGLTDYAKRKKIYVLHTENGRQYRLPFDYTAVLKGEHMEQNILLSPGDTIVVP